MKRSLSFLAFCKNNPLKIQLSITFMISYSKGHAEIGPVHSNEEEYWYTPIFGVYNPKKRTKFTWFFTLLQHSKDKPLTGSDLTNSL